MSADASSSADTTPTSMPTPITGAGSADLATESEDPRELRALLDRARERLSFYESFDRMIAEQMRRAGEMMAETVALREQAAQAVRDREAIDKAVRDERERHRAVLESALAEVRNAQPVIDTMVARLQDAIEDIAPPESTPDGTSTETPVSPAVFEPVQAEAEPAETPSAEPETTNPAPEEDLPAPEPEAVSPEPTSIEVLAHGVPSATTAIGLQAMLRGIDTITRVDAREFADGELRLHVECDGPIAEDAFSDWLAKNSGSLVSWNAKAIELSFS